MMASARSSGMAATQLGSLYTLGAAGSLTDGQLLERFLSREDPAASEAALTALVDRHGTMVLGVCRRELGDPDDALDAFQATFLVLVSKAATIRRRESVGGWLFGIARRVAAKARLESARRRRLLELLGAERALLEDTSASMPPEPEPDYSPLLAEVDRLPERFRAPLVLHYFEGLSTEATAQRLGCARGTVLSRLSRARSRLKERLEQRGIAPAVLTPAGDSLTRWLPSEPVPAWLAQATVRAASSLGLAGAAIESVVPVAVASLSRGVARSLTLARVRLAVLLSLVVAAGVTIGLAATLKPADEPRRGAVMNRAAGTTGKGPTPRADQPAKAEPLVLRGQVLDPDGKPVAGALVVLSAPGQDLGERRRLGKTGSDGRFEVTIPGPGLPPGGADPGVAVALAAVAPGFGPDWWLIDPAKRAEPVILRLRRDDVPIEGRILDREGRPIAGASVEVGYIADMPPEWIKKLRASAPRFGGPFLAFEDGNLFVPDEGDPIRPVRTGADGRFRLTGIGRDRLVGLVVEGGSIEQSNVLVSTSSDRDFKPLVLPVPSMEEGRIEAPRFDLTVAPGRTLEGTVRDRKTGSPIADARIVCISGGGSNAGGSSDARGRFRLDGVPRGDEVYLTVHVEDQPYIQATVTLKGQEDPARLDIRLMRGVWAAGRVVNATDGKPIKADIYYYPAQDNPHIKDCPDAPFLHDRLPYGSLSQTDRDGRFRLPTLPGRGLLCVQARELGYLTARPLDKDMAANFAYLSRSAYFNLSSHVLRPIAAPADKVLGLPDFRLARGRTQHIRITDPDGQPLIGARVSSQQLQWAKAGRRPLPGDELTFSLSAPGHEERILILHEGRSLGGVVVLKGDEPDPIRAVLWPTGTVTGRLVDDHGKPRPNVYLTIDGDPWADDLSNLTPTGPDGRFRIGHLIPGAKYAVQVIENDETQHAEVIWDIVDHRELNVKPGEVRDWGDVKADADVP